MDNSTGRNVLVIGAGNEFRGDDAAGLLVVRALEASSAGSVRTLELPGEGSELIEAWQSEKHVIVADASRSGAAPGIITRLDANAQEMPKSFFNYSTHAFGLAEAVETSRNLNILPEQLVIYAIEGRAFGQGAPVSADIESAVRSVVDSILGELRES